MLLRPNVKLMAGTDCKNYGSGEYVWKPWVLECEGKPDYKIAKRINERYTEEKLEFIQERTGYARYIIEAVLNSEMDYMRSIGLGIEDRGEDHE